MPRVVKETILAFKRAINGFRKAERGTLRIAYDEQDLERVVRFVDEARRNDPAYTQTLGVRTEAEYRKIIRGASCYVIEVDGEIIAVAGVFGFPDGGPDGYELGSLCVSPRYEGFRIQAAFMPLGIVTTMTRTTRARIFAGAKPGAKSEKGVKLAGFKQAAVPAKVGQHCDPCEQRPPDYPQRCCVIYYELPHEGRCKNVQLYLDSPRVVKTTREDGRRLIIDRIVGTDQWDEREFLKKWAAENCR